MTGWGDLYTRGGNQGYRYHFRISDRPRCRLLLVGGIFGDTCETMRTGLTGQYRFPEDAVPFFRIPHASSPQFEAGIAPLVSLDTLNEIKQHRLEQEPVIYWPTRRTSVTA